MPRWWLERSSRSWDDEHCMNAPFVVPSLTTTVGFLVVIAAVWLMLIVAAGAAAGAIGLDVRRWRLAAVGLIGGWATLTGVAQLAGLVGAVPPASVILYFGSSQFLALGLALTFTGGVFARGLPLWGLAGFHGFRLPLEVILHAWYEGGTLPIQMTWSGDNLDVVSGILGLGVGAVLLWARPSERHGKWGLAVVTVVGLFLLLRVATIAVTSTPGPLRAYTNDPPVLLAFHFPYGWIVPFAVSAALFMHVVAVRRLLSPRPGTE